MRLFDRGLKDHRALILPARGDYSDVRLEYVELSIFKYLIR